MPSQIQPQLPAEPSDDDVQAVAQLRQARDRLRAEIGRVVVGQDEVLDNLLAALLCRGHALMVGVPGLGKTLMAKSITSTLRMTFNRIQFTPDLMPSDIIGTDVIEEDPETGRRRLEFIQGPLFTHFLLADEINRAPPKTQAALLQAMQEQDAVLAEIICEMREEKGRRGGFDDSRLREKVEVLGPQLALEASRSVAILRTHHAIRSAA